MQTDEPAGSPSATVEQRFGEAVRLRRQTIGLSQKQLAEALTATGISLDGPSISRLEKGNRSVRLAEAVALAGILRMELGEAISEPDTPRFMRQLSRLADSALDEISSASVRFITTLMQIQELLDEEPELLDTLVRSGLPGHQGSEVEPPEQPSDWLDWYERLVAEVAENDPPWRLNPHMIDVDRVRSILSTHIERVMHPIPEEDLQDDTHDPTS